MLKFFRPRRAESLIETLIAVTVIGITTTAAMILIRTSITGNEIIGEKIVAMNLALEGIEAVKNIRDTNYLRMSSDPDNCWDTLNLWDATDCTDAATESIENGDYYLTRYLRSVVTEDLVFEWSLEEVTADDGYLTLYEFEPEPGVFTKLYAESGMPATSVFTAVPGTEDSFQRLLTVSGKNADGFDLTATVNWWIDGDMKTISLTRTIANVY